MEFENLLSDKCNYMNRLLFAFQTALETKPIRIGESMDEYFQPVLNNIKENKKSSQTFFSNNKFHIHKM